jgi:hypothetical protein
MDGMITTSTMSQNWEKRKRKSIEDIQAFFLITISLLINENIFQKKIKIFAREKN